MDHSKHSKMSYGGSKRGNTGKPIGNKGRDPTGHGGNKKTRQTADRYL